MKEETKRDEIDGGKTMLSALKEILYHRRLCRVKNMLAMCSQKYARYV
jgi:hypothetical protein